jgi:PAS domain S-box-containing protein
MQGRWTGAVYEAAIAAMPEAVVIADIGGTIRIWNPGAEQLFGFSAGEAVGAPLSLLIPERFRPAHDAGLAKAVATGHLRVAGRVLTTRSNHKDASRKLYVDFTFSLLLDEAGAVYGVMAVGRDATEKFLAARANQPPA